MAATAREIRLRWLVGIFAGSLLAAPAAGQRGARVAEDLRGRAGEATFENGRYRQAGIVFDVPAAWMYEGTVAAETPADETAHWIDPQSGAYFSAWLSKRKAAPEDISALVASAVSNKTRQREREGYRGWRVRPGSVQQTSIGGHQAVVAVADFGSDTPKVECMAWIFTPESRIFFFASLSADKLITFQPAFDRIVHSANLP
jgi:hypothetical protein